MRLLGKSFRVEYVYKDIHFIFTIYFIGKYYSDDLSVSVSPVKVHKLPTDIALSNSLAAFRIMQFQTFIDTYITLRS